MNLQKRYERMGYTYHPGHEIQGQGFFGGDGRFVLDDADATTTPCYLGDLLDMGFIRVPGGVMEPPKQHQRQQLTSGLIGLAVFGIAIAAAAKFFEKK